MKTSYDILIIGGGAAGFFAAINLAQSRPHLRIAILERGKEVLTKVRISGGGRCNVTHAEFLPNELSHNYPRGQRELVGPFHSFMTGDTMAWFEERGVALKIEADQRIFPVSDNSQTIIDCFLKEANQYQVAILTQQSVRALSHIAKDNTWEITTKERTFTASKIVVATGSNPKIWELLKGLGHTITAAVPSLFTFNIKDDRIKDLMGLSTEANIKVIDSTLESQGPTLITHWGMSGPGILKISAWGAEELHSRNYHFDIAINWLVVMQKEEVLDALKALKTQHAKQSPHTYAQFDLPKRLWQNLLVAAQITPKEQWANLTKKQLDELAKELVEGVYSVTGKSTYKDEFVTAGGVALKEVNFKTFESKLHKNLYFAGEVLNIDAITGGFNFQNAWTGGYIVAKSIAAQSQ